MKGRVKKTGYERHGSELEWREGRRKKEEMSSEVWYEMELGRTTREQGKKW